MSLYKSDIDCINEIKSDHSEDALKVLVGRHSGIYYDQIHKNMPKNDNSIIKRELLEEKESFIYQCALEFNPEIKIKFSTFVGNRIKWKCWNLQNAKKRQKQDSLETSPEPSTFGNLYSDVEQSELNDIIGKVLKSYPDKRAKRIFRLRYVEGQRNKVMPWRKISKKLDMSIQGCINIHNKLITTIKKEYEQSNP